MDWHESDQSEEELHVNSRKRSSRACDQCRRTKSKCERSVNETLPCKSCAATGTACTFLGPSYKRGPPKGYIHAIEQRWHQVEALFGAILQCPDTRVQTLIEELKQDDLAREIINRVDMGPYGPSGRLPQPAGATKEEFFASVLRSNERSSTRESSRTRRQSRVSREIVSSTQDHGLSVVPTKEWQDKLSARLASAGAQASAYGCIVEPANAQNANERKLDGVHGNATFQSEVPTQPDWNGLYTLEQAGDVEDDSNATTESMGHLSLDEHREVRYHGKSSGLHLLSRSLNTDDRNEGIWRLPMARVWPPPNYTLIPGEDSEYMLPPPHVQDQLLELYFTYTHPVFPVVHKTRFLAEYNARKHKKLPFNTSTSKLEPSQEVTPLLLLAMFAICSRYSDEEISRSQLNDEMHEPGKEYLQNALAILTQNFHRTRPSTVQALLLLGYREFGTGSMEQGWIFIGMAIRMAFDLGMNCDSTNWRINGHELFTREELQTRRQIWWSCYLTDRYSSAYMGRPLMIKDEDYDAPMPECGLEEESRLWQPIPSPFIDNSYSPVPGRVLSCFCAGGKLAIIVGDVLTRVYPVRTSPHVSKRALLAELDSRLDRWYISLPDTLRYDVASRRAIPPPQILFLHIRYWGSVLLLNRAFIPNWKGTGPCPNSSPMELKAFDLAQGAASRISAIVTTYKEKFTLKRSSPFMSTYILSAAIMHILTLTLRPSNVQASLGLEQCMSALEDIKKTWASAARAWDLLNGIQLGTENVHIPRACGAERHKRPADDAFGIEKGSDYLQQEISGNTRLDAPPRSENGVQELSTRIMAHILGLDIPGVEPTVSFYPGYDWWSQSRSNAMLTPPQQAVMQSHMDPLSMPTSGPGNNAGWLREEAVPDGAPSNNPSITFPYNFNGFGP